MAIQWKWDEKCGEVTFRREDGYTYTSNLYVGNCFLIMINEWTDEEGKEKYALSSFFADADHMERCLKNDIFSKYDKLTAITINKAKCRNYKKIISLLTEYLDDIDISVYKEGEYTWKEYKEPEPIISDVRMREIAEAAMGYLNDEGSMGYFLEDRYIDLTPEEKEYFGIYEDEDYEEAEQILRCLQNRR